MEQIIRICKQTERTHKGLGIPLTLNILSVLANKGIFNIASRGSGKGAIINSIHHFDKKSDYHITSWYNMTLHEICEKIGKCYDLTMIWKVPEWSTLQKYHRELLLTIGVTVISDGHFYKFMTKMDIVDIQNCNLVMLIGIQPLKLRALMTESETWESLSTDRFIKLVMINPLRTEKDYTKDPPKYDLPDNIYDTSHKVTFYTDMNMTIKLFMSQVSEGRAKQFATDFLTAYAILNDKEIINVRDESDFCMLYEPYLQLYNVLSFSEDIDKPDTISAGGFRLLEKIAKSMDGISSSQLAKIFKVYEKKYDQSEFDNVSTRTISRHLQILKHNDIIQNSKVGHIPYYRLSKNYLDYFQWYRDNWI